MTERVEEKNLMKVLLVGVDLGEEDDFEYSMEELKSLAQAAERIVVGIITQKLDFINKALYIGRGKVNEVREFAIDCEADEVIFDNTLSPSQIRNLGRELNLPVMDRTNLILDIFALRARTKEAKLQVESARLQYMLPRLVGIHEALSRQGGASGSMSNKGAGEKKLELDRRKIEHRISELKKALNHISETRMTQRKRRSDSRIPKVALVGYTNAGKSTILNHMVELYGECDGKTVLEKDMLFATLETSVRSIDTGDHRPFFLSDTVGFIHKLPHGLIQAFHSTLEEVQYADLLVQVVDFSAENYKHEMRVTEETLKELNAGDIPMITVYNKTDLCNLIDIPKSNDKQIYMSARAENGIEELIVMIKECIYQNQLNCEFLFPYKRGDLVSYFMENATVKNKKFLENGVYMQVSCNLQDAEKYAIFRR